MDAAATQSLPDISPSNDEINMPEYYMDGGIPVVKPTLEQFKDFRRFINKIDPLGAEAGLVKVIPPREWLESLSPITKKMTDSIRLDSAIKQHFTGTGGTFTQLNMGCRKRLSLADWKAMCESEKHRPPSFGTASGRRQESSRTVKRMRVESTGKLDDCSPEVCAPAVTTATENHDAVDLDVSPTSEKERIPSDLIPSKGYFPDSPDYINELERSYWKNLTFIEPWYGADIAGTFFDDQVQEWNIGKLDSLLSNLKRPVPGVNTPYLYFGMWKATFSWHLEDMDLYSINYIHFGAPKQWYVIPPEHKDRFERVCQGVFAPDYRKCSEFMRHKTFQLSPKFLAHHSIPYRKIVHREGEFMLTFPYAYHAGYNLGFNCAESTNFATERWVDIGRRAKCCECVNYSVRIDIDALLGLKNTAGKRERLRKQVEVKRCLICGKNDRREDLLVVEARERFIHRHCAAWIPELSVESEIIASEENSSEHENEEDVVEQVVGLECIPRARWKLECKYCDYQKGACIQCSSARCVRAFHPSCAIEQQICMQTRPLEQNGQTSTIFECFCQQHDPRKVKEKLDKRQIHAAAIAQAIDESKDSAKVWTRWSDGNYYFGRVGRDLRERSLCLVMYFDGYVKLVGYADIQLERPIAGSIDINVDSIDLLSNL